ncbi:MAG: DbpA RNA binding domain-containing protein, partial [Sphingomonadaceae bacterium]
PRRKRVESMLRHAKIKADWIDAPSREAIRAQDRERLLQALLQPVEIDEADREIATRLMAERSPEEIAAMLVQAHRASLPEPEELIENTPEARREAQKERHRPGFEDVVWFRMDIGRRQNADPRWILPLLCRRGHITRNEIGAIRIGPAETHFQVPRAIAGKFSDALERTAGSESEEDAVRIEASDGPPRDAARQNRKKGRHGNDGGQPKYRAKPHRKGPGKGPGKGPKPGGKKRGGPHRDS